MKYLFLLILSFNVFAEEPPANTFRGQVYGYDIAVFVYEIFPRSQIGVKALYRSSDSEWTYLTETNIFLSDIQNKQYADAKFKDAINEINMAIDSVLRDSAIEKEYGQERIEWLINEKLRISDNHIVILQ